MLDPERGESGIARGQVFCLLAHANQAAALQQQVEFVLPLVRVKDVVLARFERVQSGKERITLHLAVGLAVAPKSGQKLRADIGNKIDDYLESASKKAGELRDSATKLAQSGLREVQRTKCNATEKVKDTVNGAVDAVNSVAASGASDAHGAIDHAVDTIHYHAQKGHEAINQAADAVYIDKV
jgi:gas vesicle protein